MKNLLDCVRTTEQIRLGILASKHVDWGPCREDEESFPLIKPLETLGMGMVGLDAPGE